MAAGHNPTPDSGAEDGRGRAGISVGHPKRRTRFALQDANACRRRRQSAVRDGTRVSLEVVGPSHDERHDDAPGRDRQGRDAATAREFSADRFFARAPSPRETQRRTGPVVGRVSQRCEIETFRFGSRPQHGRASNRGAPQINDRFVAHASHGSPPAISGLFSCAASPRTAPRPRGAVRDRPRFLNRSLIRRGMDPRRRSGPSIWIGSGKPRCGLLCEPRGDGRTRGAPTAASRPSARPGTQRARSRRRTSDAAFAVEWRAAEASASLQHRPAPCWAARERAAEPRHAMCRSSAASAKFREGPGGTQRPGRRMRLARGTKLSARSRDVIGAGGRVRTQNGRGPQNGTGKTPASVLDGWRRDEAAPRHGSARIRSREEPGGRKGTVECGP